MSNVGLILGVAGADPGASVVRIAGLAGLLAGAISMAAGEYNSMRVQSELFQRELDLERKHLEENPEAETRELSQLYEARGIDPVTAHEMAGTMMADPERALQAHAREELGIAPDSLGSPIGAAVSSLGAFALGAVLPLVPWYLADGGAAVVASLVVAIVAAVVVGLVTARLTERGAVTTAGRQVLFTLVPAAITYAIGSAVGVGVA